MKLIKIESNTIIQENRSKYFKSLPYPFEKFWASVIIGNSDFFQIEDNNQTIGHLSINNNKELTQFFIDNKYISKSYKIIENLIDSKIIYSALISTFETTAIASLIEFKKEISIEAYQFFDTEKTTISLENYNNLSFRCAVNDTIDLIKKHFEEPFTNYYSDLIKTNSLFVVFNNNDFLGIGEFRNNEINNKYADIGMEVVENHRRKNIASYIVSSLKDHCYKNNLIPTAGCDFTNIGSKKTLIKMGMYPIHKILRISF